MASQPTLSKGNLSKLLGSSLAADQLYIYAEEVLMMNQLSRKLGCLPEGNHAGRMRENPQERLILGNAPDPILAPPHISLPKGERS
jgi:hypothetical protein